MLHLQFSAGVPVCIIPNTLFSQQGIIRPMLHVPGKKKIIPLKDLLPQLFHSLIPSHVQSSSNGL